MFQVQKSRNSTILLIMWNNVPGSEEQEQYYLTHHVEHIKYKVPTHHVEHVKYNVPGSEEQEQYYRTHHVEHVKYKVPG